MYSIKLILITIVLAGISSCYREVVLTDTAEEVFELFVSPEMQDFLYNSRDTSYSIDDPELQLLLQDHPLNVIEMKIRGKSSRNFQRKSFAVKLNEPIYIEDGSQGTLFMLSRFKLLALAMDYTYIENRLAFGLMKASGLMPLFYKFVEFRINGATQGVYLLLEDPEQFYKEYGSEFILRRGYHHVITDADYEPSNHYIPEEEYIARFKEIYSILTELAGAELYDALSQRINLQQYFRKMGIDYLLMNGDYTDEVYLYSMIQQDAIRYQLIPWDYDDIFTSQPHEVGRTWGTGKLFGTRIYETHQDVLDEIGDKLIFSIEEDLDYVIARDSFMYARYEEEISGLFDELEPQIFEELFSQLKGELTPYYNNKEVVAQSQFDRDPSSRSLWENNMTEKQLLLEKRFNEMKNHLKISK